MKLLGFLLLLFSVVKVIAIGFLLRNDAYKNNCVGLFDLDIDDEKIIKGLICYSILEGMIGIVCGLYLSGFQC